MPGSIVMPSSKPSPASVCRASSRSRRFAAAAFGRPTPRSVAPEEHVHRHWHHIEAIIDKSSLTARQKDLAKRIFLKLGEAEASVHGVDLAKIHFHEVGAVDSIVDIVGSAVGLDLLGVDRFEASPVPTGRGWVKAAHGRMPLPAPATAELLRGVPLAESMVEGEMTTPTGAAILTTVVERFASLPALTIESIGLGAGTREMPGQANILRLFVGTVDLPAASDRVWVLETNLDDLPGEIVGYTMTKLMEAGALDAFVTPIQMKKNRPGVMVSVLCDETKIPALEDLLFRETATLGIRRYPVSRHKLKRQAVEIVDRRSGRSRGSSAGSESGRRRSVPSTTIASASPLRFASAPRRLRRGPCCVPAPQPGARREASSGRSRSTKKGRACMTRVVRRGVPGPHRFGNNGNCSTPIRAAGIQGGTLSMTPETWTLILTAAAFLLLGIALSPLAWVASCTGGPASTRRSSGAGGRLSIAFALEARIEQIETISQDHADIEKRPAISMVPHGPHRPRAVHAQPERADKAGAESMPAPTLIAVPSLAAPPSEREASINGISERYAAIWSLADSGASTDVIARATGQPIGQIDLILGLRRQIDTSRTKVPHEPPT